MWKGILGIWDSAEIQCGIGKDARIVNGKRYLPVTRGAGCATLNVMRLFQLVQFVKCWQIFLELNSKKTVSKFRKRKKKGRCIVFTSWTKCEIREFHVAVVQGRQRNVQKSVMHVQSCCFANLNLRVLVCRSRCRRRGRCLSFLIVVKKEREGEIRDPSSRLDPVERLDYNVSINNVCTEFYSKGVLLGNLIV